MRLRRAQEGDIPFVMATERLPGYAQVVGRWEADRHRAALGDGRHAVFIGEEADGPIGFVILRDWASPERVTLVKRIAVARPGEGAGRRLLAAAVDEAFRATDAHRIWLGTYPDNLRARRAYEAVGFVAEGIARGSAFFGGTFRDELVMAILRPEWEARNGSTGAVAG